MPWDWNPPDLYPKNVPDRGPETPTKGKEIAEVVGIAGPPTLVCGLLHYTAAAIGFGAFGAALVLWILLDKRIKW